MNVRDTLAGLQSWPTTEDFYADPASPAERRRRSGEMDFGCWWLAGNLGRTQHRISAVLDTGEFYVIRLVTGLRDEPPGEVFLAGRFEAGDYRDAERILDGWADRCGEQDSLEWALDRLTPTLGLVRG